MKKIFSVILLITALTYSTPNVDCAVISYTYDKLGRITKIYSQGNAPPVVASQNITVFNDEIATGVIAATNQDDAPLVYSISQFGAKGTAAIDPATGAFTYTPKANVAGRDSFTVSVSNGVSYGTGTVSVQIEWPVAPPPTAATVNAPHNAASGVNCGHCHSYSLWWRYAPLKSSTQFVQVTESVCRTCHGQSNSSAKQCQHSSQSMGSKHRAALGNWSTTCMDCHDPHFQPQLNWRQSLASELYLVTGVIGTPSTANGNTTFTYSNLSAKAGWSSPATWSHKNNTATNPARGLILVVDTVDVAATFQVIAATASTITVKGPVDPAHAGQTFGLIYGQMLKSQVKFFNPADSQYGFVNSTNPTEGVCQVCHTRTYYWTANGQNTSHHPVGSDGPCTNCHKASQGYQPIP